MKGFVGPFPLLLALAVASCSKEPPSASPPGAKAKVIVIKVDGMQRGEGGKA